MATTLITWKPRRSGMTGDANWTNPWLHRQVSDLLQQYRDADAVTAETAAVVETRLSNGSTEAALRELLDARDF